MALDLAKKQEIVRLTLEKRKVPTGIIMAVKVMIDVSESTRRMFNNGMMQELVDRLIPVGMRFDDNQSLEAYAFSDKVQRVDDIKPADFGSYVNKVFLPQIKDKVLWGGTLYSVAWKQLADDMVPEEAGFFKKLFGGKKPESQPPAFTMFVTDGDTNYDEVAAENEIIRLGAMNCYLMLVGVGRRSFAFLEKMAAEYDHVGFVSFPKLDETTDEDMYAALLNDDLCSWIKKTAQ
jgi:hypothetical protein